MMTDIIQNYVVIFVFNLRIQNSFPPVDGKLKIYFNSTVMLVHINNVKGHSLKTFNPCITPRGIGKYYTFLNKITFYLFNLFY